MLTIDHMWQIFESKDRAYDGVFVIGVMSTKIYCRPSCSARPHRKNVRFFADNASAEAAGLRPCKRCTPDTIPVDILLCQHVSRYIESCHETPALHAIADAVGYSPFHVQRTFRRIMGITPFGYAQAIRLMRVQQYLHESNTVAEAIERAGYGSISAFYHAHKGHATRSTQTQDRQYALCTYAGLVVIGIFSSIGIQYCGVYADEASAEAALRGLGIDTHSASVQHTHILEAILQQLQDDTLPIQLAIDIRATAFQHKVWQAIRKIPIGHTASYQEIADTIGQPGARRAVANACAQNPLALITPCHRVIQANKVTGEYKWGAPLKRQLLTYEAKGTTAD